jgi:hypothetical protein
MPDNADRSSRGNGVSNDGLISWTNAGVDSQRSAPRVTVVDALDRTCLDYSNPRLDVPR